MSGFGANVGIAEYTWATKPATASSGKIICISDIARGGSLWRGNGTNWLPLGGHVVLAEGAVASSVTGTTALTTLESITILAGIMGSNGQLRITTLWSAGAKNANVKTAYIKFGTNSLQSFALTSVLSAQSLAYTRNRGSAANQINWVNSITPFMTTSGVLPTSAIDTSVEKNILLQAQLADSSDTVTLEAYSVELIR